MKSSHKALSVTFFLLIIATIAFAWLSSQDGSPKAPVVEEAEVPTVAISEELPKRSNRSYTEMLQWVKHIKDSLNSAYQAGNSDIVSVGNRFQSIILDSIVPYWMGTQWDFNGHTNTPNVGQVACGYFVSTTLKHMGINLNRYRMAQQAALAEIKCLHPNGGYSYIFKKGKTEAALCDQLRDSLGEGLYMVGLDFHVGYLLITRDTEYMIHSAYYYPAEVVVEIASESLAFAQSNGFAIGKISGNEYLMKSWLQGTVVPTENCK